MRLAIELVWVELDERFPRPLRMGGAAGGEMAGCDANPPCSLAINGRVYAGSRLERRGRS